MTVQRRRLLVNNTIPHNAIDSFVHVGIDLCRIGGLDLVSIIRFGPVHLFRYPHDF